MSMMKNTLKRFIKEESGATMVEYAIMVALIAAICIAVVKIIGNRSNAAAQNVDTAR